MTIAKEEIIPLVEEGYSIDKLSKYFKCSWSNIRYYLKKFGLKTKNPNSKTLSKIGEQCQCVHCGRIYIYTRKAGHKHTVCNSCLASKRKYHVKKKLVEYKGGKCVECGFVGDAVSFDFHHTKSNKDFNIAGNYNRTWKILLEEVDKCVLLCSNCHRVVHSKISFRFKDTFYNIKNRKTAEKNKCSKCQKEISKQSKLCWQCFTQNRSTKIDWPPTDELQKMLGKSTYVAVGMKLGVSDNAIRRRLKKLGALK